MRRNVSNIDWQGAKYSCKYKPRPTHELKALEQEKRKRIVFSGAKTLFWGMNGRKRKKTNNNFPFYQRHEASTFYYISCLIFSSSSRRSFAARLEFWEWRRFTWSLFSMFWRRRFLARMPSSDTNRFHKVHHIELIRFSKNIPATSHKITSTNSSKHV